MIATYDDEIANISNVQDQRISTSISSNTTNQVEAFFRETAENKENVQKFRDSLEYIWDLPEILLLSIPFLDLAGSSFIVFFKGVVWFLIGAMLILVLYKAISTDILIFNTPFSLSVGLLFQQR